MSKSAFGSAPTTRWSLIARAASEDREALAELLRLYLPALRAHLVFNRGVEFNEAEEVIQCFVMRKVLEKRIVASARKDRGKFRAFLLTALNNYFIDWMRHNNVTTEREVSLGEGVPRQSNPDPIPSLAETAWASEVVHEALRRMESHCSDSGQEICWQIFDCRLLGPALRDEKAEPYARAVKRLGLASPREAANRLVTAKRIFARILREVVDGYVRGGAQEIDEEVAELKRILERP